MTQILTTEVLAQIKADIAARKAMPEFGKSIEGNIERLRVIGATRNHFSTETVELLVKALDVLAANREAQPIYQIWDDGRWYDAEEHIWRETYNEACKSQFRIVYTAPPAPAVPTNAQPIGVVSGWEKITGEPMRYKFESSKSKAELMGAAIYLEPPAQAIPQAMTRDNVPFRYTAPQRWDAYTDGYNACRAAMLAQPQIEPQNIPDGLAESVNRLLDSDGSRGCFSAVRSYDARE